MPLLRYRWWLLATCLLTTPTFADLFYAPPAPEENAPNFSGSAELGYTRLTGNTNTQTLLAKGRLTWLTGRFTHTFRAETRSVQDNDSTTSEQYLAAARERYELADDNYLFGFGRWERDRFSGYDWQFTTIGGYGRQLLTGPTHVLSAEVGPGYRHDEYAAGGSDDLPLGYTALDYTFNISDDISFDQELSAEATHINVTTRSLSSITSQFNSHLAMRVSYDIKSNTHPPPETDARTDTTTSVSLLYSW
ncbi:DUF481 domain-containing protein [Salinicola rhizosphaerae]|uniref:DUF481 domain-containing protein n=1 Tax=Salinicola rhizosphaerae TaxID=1443141 RepID=A0ABQ3E1E2_9GAMM|nr:DUF481 domain-containing protein [Salinicola rhizosphaerae]GHB20407.1 hypothetical protein GCM10009038_18930 [Salinicola rhizosphaerae]